MKYSQSIVKSPLGLSDEVRENVEEPVDNKQTVNQNQCYEYPKQTDLVSFSTVFEKEYTAKNRQDSGQGC